MVSNIPTVLTCVRHRRRQSHRGGCPRCLAIRDRPVPPRPRVSAFPGTARPGTSRARYRPTLDGAQAGRPLRDCLVYLSPSLCSSRRWFRPARYGSRGSTSVLYPVPSMYVVLRPRRTGAGWSLSGPPLVSATTRVRACRGVPICDPRDLLTLKSSRRLWHQGRTLYVPAVLQRSGWMEYAQELASLSNFEKLTRLYMEGAAVSSSATLRPYVRINAGTATSSESYFGIHDSADMHVGAGSSQRHTAEMDLVQRMTRGQGRRNPENTRPATKDSGQTVRHPCVHYVARLSSAPFCAPGVESGSGQNNVTARAVTRGCKKRGTGSPSPSWGVFTGFPTLCFPARQSWHLSGA